jgi:hypothetical protein
MLSLITWINPNSGPKKKTQPPNKRFTKPPLSVGKAMVNEMIHKISNGKHLSASRNADRDGNIYDKKKLTVTAAK